MTFLLGTDTCIDALRRNRTVLDRLMAESRSDIAVSVISEGELRTGAARSTRPVKTLDRVENFLAPLTVLEFTSADAAVYGRIRAALERTGKGIRSLDTLIAAHAVARGLVLVSRNRREFDRVPALRVESWS